MVGLCLQPTTDMDATCAGKPQLIFNDSLGGDRFTSLISLHGRVGAHSPPPLEPCSTFYKVNTSIVYLSLVIFVASQLLRCCNLYLT